MQNSYTETAVTLFGLAMLALGTLAMIVRALVRHRRTLHTAGQQMIADVKRGEGFTFHKQRRDTADAGSAAPPILRLREWLNLVNHHPDEVPHLFIEGGSGAGKTTLALGILGDRRDPVAVVGVKPDDAWGVGYVYKSDARPTVLAELVREVRRRLDDNDRSGLTVVLDDFTRLASDHKEAVELYKLIADVGRSLRIRLMLIARGRLVKGIGASGESDLRDHFVFLVVSRSHSATLEYDEDTFPIETAQIREIARPIPDARWWRPTSNAVVASDQRGEHGKLLTALLTQPTAAGTITDPAARYIQGRDQAAAGARPGTAAELDVNPSEHVPGAEHAFPAQERDGTSSDVGFTTEEIAQIAALITRGEKDKSEIIKAMPRYSGRKYKSYAQLYDRLRTAIEDVNEPVM